MRSKRRRTPPSHVHEGDEDESNIEVDYDAESADEDEQPALRNPLDRKSVV